MEKEFRRVAHGLFGRYFRERRADLRSLREDLVTSRMDVSVDQWLSTAVLASLLAAAFAVPCIYLFLFATESPYVVVPTAMAGITGVVIAVGLFFFCGRFRPKGKVSFWLEDERSGEGYSLNRPILILLAAAGAAAFVFWFPGGLSGIKGGLEALVRNPGHSLQAIFGWIRGAAAPLVDRIEGVLAPTRNLIRIAYGLVPLGAFLATLFTFNYYPRVKAWERKRRIDGVMDSAVGLMGSVAGVGLTPFDSMKFLAKEEPYGEMSEEMTYLVRDVDLYGMDLVSALRKLSGETASERLKSFLQGAVTTITSGGDLREYFMVKSEKYSRETERELEEYLDSLGLVAEIFLVAGVVAPTLIIVMLAIMAIMGHVAPIMLYGVVLIVPAVTFAVSLMTETLEPPSVR